MNNYDLTVINQNNKRIGIENGTTGVITYLDLTIGNYTETNFVIMLQSMLTLAGYLLTVTLNNHRLQITNGAGTNYFLHLNLPSQRRIFGVQSNIDKFELVIGLSVTPFNIDLSPIKIIYIY